MDEKFIAYKGKKFTIEWYHNVKKESEALEYFEELTPDRQKKFAHLLYIMGEMGQIRNEEKFTSEDDQIYAFKPQPDRFLCFFFAGGKIIITNAYEKKSQKMPPKEKERALKLKADYINRVKGGAYYD
jgi:phage-related protein